MVSINWTNVTNAQEFMAVANTQTGSWFWTVTLFLIWGVMSVSMLPFGFPAALMASSFACLMLGTILTYAGVVAWGWTVFFFGWIIVIIFYKIMTSNTD